MNKIVQPLKWHGGKHYLAKRIIELMPQHVHYVEPFFGGGSVLLSKSPEGISEVVNDVHQELTNFWRVLQNDDQFKEFSRRVEVIPFSQVEWEQAAVPIEMSTELPDTETASTDATTAIQRALKFFVRCRQSRAGKFDAFATLSRNRTRRAMNEQASSWLTAVEALPAVAARLKRVVILCDRATKVISSQDGPNTLFYLDPPYVHESRVTTNDYEFEMTQPQHEELLRTILSCSGNVMLSGYPNELYDNLLKDWRVHDITIDNKASSAKIKPRKVERIWMNY